MRVAYIVFILSFITMVGSLMVQPVIAANKVASIAAVVGEDAISMAEFQDRLRLIIVTTGTKPTKEAIAQMSPQALDSLINERIQMQEAEKLGITVTAQEIHERFEQIAGMNNVDVEQFQAMVKNSGVNIETLRNQFRAQVAWTKVVQSKLRSQVRVTNNDIANQLERYKRGLGKSEYLLAQIFLPFEDEKEKAKVKKLSSSLIAQVKSGKARFSRVAMQFSRAPGAHIGGDMGWIQEGQLAEELDNVVKATAKGQITKPVALVDGYYIFLVRDKRVLSEETMPSEEDIRQVLGAQRLHRLQERYLADLKASTFIDVRV